jgi:predicted nucleic acid-binding protein
VAIDFLRGKQKAVSAVASALTASDAVGISTISMFEILHPIQRRKLARHEKQVRGFFRQLRVLPFDPHGAEEAAKMMGNLLRIGKQVNALDVMIAGTTAASSVEKIISTDRDYEEIGKVSDLRVEVLG